MVFGEARKFSSIAASAAIASATGVTTTAIPAEDASEEAVIVA